MNEPETCWSCNSTAKTVDENDQAWCDDCGQPWDQWHSAVRAGQAEHTHMVTEAIREERERQVCSEGFSPEHDDHYKRDELARAAACYVMPARFRAGRIDVWPRSQMTWKPTPNDRIRELRKAAALIVAEIERLERMEVDTSSEDRLDAETGMTEDERRAL